MNSRNVPKTTARKDTAGNIGFKRGCGLSLDIPAAPKSVEHVKSDIPAPRQHHSRASKAVFAFVQDSVKQTGRGVISRVLAPVAYPHR